MSSRGVPHAHRTDRSGNVQARELSPILDPTDAELAALRALKTNGRAA